MTTLLRLLAISLLSIAFNGYASDLAKEKRWADQVVDAIMDGDAVWLNDGKSDFLGIYTEADENKGRSVIIMHGTGIHPDWQQIIQPLRIGLIEHNWNTLSIQMPILHNEAEYPEYAPLYDEVAPRINAAIKHLKSNGSKEIVLIGHSQGASMTAYYLSTNKPDINGFVAIGMGAFAKDARMNAVKSLEKITVPVLDIYGDDDLENIMATVGDRATSAKKAGNKNFTQIEVAGSNHMFDGKDDELVETVARWLDKVAGRQGKK
jgi:pimeloyl-ACP methyl ester carboxylesterase